MTRRTLILAGLATPFLTASERPFWDEKDPQNWTDEERRQILTKSPWARPATVSYDTGPGTLTGRDVSPDSNGTYSNRRGRTPGMPVPSSASAKENYEAIVRWESALPVRDANRNQSKDDPAANYILLVAGDLPMLGRRSNDESEAEFQQRLEILKQFSKLEKKGDPIYLTRVAYAPAGTLFYFERNDLIRPGDRQVTFVTKLGPVEVKAKFPLHEMMYRGKLEL